MTLKLMLKIISVILMVSAFVIFTIVPPVTDAGDVQHVMSAVKFLSLIEMLIGAIAFYLAGQIEQTTFSEDSLA